jgi:hypothetical protein
MSIDRHYNKTIESFEKQQQSIPLKQEQVATLKLQLRANDTRCEELIKQKQTAKKSTKERNAIETKVNQIAQGNSIMFHDSNQNLLVYI